MTHQSPSRRPAFSSTTSWVGVILLGAGLTQVGLPASEASAPGPQTASIEYSSIDNSFGVLSGGQQRDFTTGLYGWQGTTFASLGMMGIGTGVLAGGGILAALRRRFSKRRRATGIEETRID